MALAATQVILSTSNYISACSSMLRCHGDGSRGAFYSKTLINSPISLTKIDPCKIQQDNETKMKYMPQYKHNTKPLWSSSEQCWQIGSFKCRGIIKWTLIQNFHWSTYTWKCVLQKRGHFIPGSQIWPYNPSHCNTLELLLHTFHTDPLHIIWHATYLSTSTHYYI